MVLLAILFMAFGVFILLSLILIGLFEAPWPILLGLLLLGLYSFQRLSTENPLRTNESPLLNSLAKLPDAVSPIYTGDTAILPGHENLVYRGVHYHRTESCQTELSKTDPLASPGQLLSPPDPRIMTQPILIEGIYRGKRWQRLVQRSGLVSPTPTLSQLTYRGHKVQSSSQKSEVVD